MTDDPRELAALRALEALSPTDAASVDDAARLDLSVAETLAHHQQTVAALERSLPRGTPPADLFERVLAATGRSEPAVVVALRPRRRIAWTITAFAAVAAAILTLAITKPWTSTEQPVARAALAAGHVTGSVVLYHNRIVVRVDGLAPAPPGHHYQLWVLPRGATTMRPVAALSLSGGHTSISAPLPASGSYRAVNVSIDPNTVPETTPGTSVVTAVFVTA